MAIQAVDFLVRKAGIQTYQFKEYELDLSTLAPGQVLFEVDKFAFTANNVTYALLGENFQYWQFFPTADDEWGKIPVWGFGNVIYSNHNDIEIGERMYGYFPLASHVVVEPANVTPGSFYDGASHRHELSPIYNQYMRVTKDPAYVPEHEALQALFRPLFTTSFLLDDFLANNGFFGADTVILSSASSKTAFGVAFLLHHHRPQRESYEIIGLTSPRNLDFVNELGCYDQALTYEQVSELDPEQTVVFVDIAGNADIRAKLHHHYEDNMAYSCLVGASHWDEVASSKALPGAEPKVFFAPSQAQKRIKEWGPAEFQMRLSNAWEAFLEPIQNWITVHESSGPTAVEQVYQSFLAGKANPNTGYILSLTEGPEGGN